MHTDEFKQAVEEQVRNYRPEHRYAQTRFAEMIDIQVNFLSEIEDG